jgi:hypothetical protein
MVVFVIAQLFRRVAVVVGLQVMVGMLVVVPVGAIQSMVVRMAVLVSMGVGMAMGMLMRMSRSIGMAVFMPMDMGVVVLMIVFVFVVSHRALLGEAARISGPDLQHARRSLRRIELNPSWTGPGRQS